MNLINVLGWFSEKVENFWEWFKGIIDKYIGSGVTAMLITLALIIIVIVVVKKFASKQVLYE